jgi:PAS domain S-box-containing protein
MLTPSTDGFYKALVDSSSDAIVSVDLDDLIITWNSAAERMFGYEKAHALGQPITMLLPVNVVSNGQPRLARRIETGSVTDHYATVRRHRDGSHVNVWLTVSPIRNDPGLVIGASIIARAVGALEREQGRVCDAETATQRLAAIIEGSDDGIVSKTLDGIVTSWNPGAERIFGFTAEEMIGASITVLFPPDRLNEEPQILERLQRGERVDHFETVRRRKTGELIDVSVTISPVRDSSGTIIGASKIARDISAWKKVQQRLAAYATEMEAKVTERTATLQDTISELEAFSYSLSHDMRAPLRAIQSFTEIVIEDYGDKIPDGLEHLRNVVSAARRMDRLIRDVLNFARTSRADLAVAPVNVGLLLREIINERPEFRPPAATITVNEPIPPVLGHDASLTQCFTNLLDNAVKFVAPGTQPRIRIYTRDVGANVQICVADNGIGIDAEAKSKLFGIFERAPAAKSYQGTGVGLAIVKKAATRMGGSTGVESTLGLGSIFWIELKKA